MGEKIATTWDGLKESTVSGPGFQLDKVGNPDCQRKHSEHIGLSWWPTIIFKNHNGVILGVGQEWKPGQ